MVDTIRTKEYGDFVGKLRKARLEAGLRQIDVAKKLKRTQSYVSRVEVGEQRLDILELQKFAKLYDKDLNYFVNLGFSEEQMLKRILDSQEHTDLINNSTEYIKIKDDYFIPHLYTSKNIFISNQGFENVYQLEEGIINYINKFPNDYFEGSCFVFDDRLISRNGNMIISKCELCNKESDEYINCHNIDCNKLFISYKDCQEKLNKHCSEKCEKVKRHRPETGKWYDALGIVKNYYRKTKIVETRLNKGIKLNEKIRKNDKLYIVTDRKEMQDTKNKLPIIQNG